MEKNDGRIQVPKAAKSGRSRLQASMILRVKAFSHCCVTASWVMHSLAQGKLFQTGADKWEKGSHWRHHRNCLSIVVEVQNGPSSATLDRLRMARMSCMVEVGAFCPFISSDKTRIATSTSCIVSGSLILPAPPAHTTTLGHQQ